MRVWMIAGLLTAGIASIAEANPQLSAQTLRAELAKKSNSGNNPNSIEIETNGCWPRTPADISDLKISKAQSVKTSPIVLSIDGMDLASIQELKAVTIGEEGRYVSYLKPRMVNHWARFIEQKSTFHIPWSGNPNDTSKIIPRVKNDIEKLSLLAKNREKPFIIVAHSWGSVLAYRAIQELASEGKLVADEISQFVTFGSPLNSNHPVIGLKKSARVNFDRHSDLQPYVSIWRNYWMKEDFISASIPQLKKNDQELCSRFDYFVKAHDDYHGGKTIDPLNDLQLLYWNKISADIERSLPSAKSPDGKTAGVELPELFGIRLGMSESEAKAILKTRFSTEPHISFGWCANEEAEYRRASSNRAKRAVTKTCATQAHVKVQGAARESGTLNVLFAEDFEKVTGTVYVRQLRYSHSFGGAQTSEDPLIALKKIFGETHAPRRVRKNVDCSVFGGTINENWYYDDTIFGLVSVAFRRAGPGTQNDTYCVSMVGADFWQRYNNMREDFIRSQQPASMPSKF